MHSWGLLGETKKISRNKKETSKQKPPVKRTESALVDVDCFLLDLQLRPYRTDDYLPKLYYESSRFTAFSNQWVVKAHVNDNKKDPNLSAKRSLAYQVVLKSKVAAPFRLHFVALKGPFGDININPAIHECEFSNENTETAFKELPIAQSTDCNKLLAAKTVNMRLIMFQVSK